ncbi:MAG: DUF456 domain-containing protein [Verrucomicrobia bacterium]|nr:DUF456 domain-containing protein [Verrucomicrobiota bacterium]
MWNAAAVALDSVGHVAGWAAVVLLCCVGVALCGIGLSGMWLVVGASAIATMLSSSGFPTWTGVVVIAVLAACVDVAEWCAGHWGVRRRGGSRLAALTATFGGLLGAFLGLFIPIFLIGSLLGMMAGSFTCAYLVERHRLQSAGPAVRIATGAFLASLAVVLLKITAGIGMALWLWIGLVVSSAS